MSVKPLTRPPRYLPRCQFGEQPLYWRQAIKHYAVTNYFGAEHPISLTPGGVLATMYGKTEGRVNSAHHQGVIELTSSLNLEARAPDGVCEGFRSPQHRFVVAVQWHPEFHHLATGLLPAEPLMRAFFAACVPQS